MADQAPQESQKEAEIRARAEAERKAEAAKVREKIFGKDS
jgi:hypothetical protein